MKGKIVAMGIVRVSISTDRNLYRSSSLELTIEFGNKQTADDFEKDLRALIEKYQ